MFDTYLCTSNKGTNGALFLPTQPGHGTVTQDANDQFVTYQNNGDTSTSDSFVWQDFFGVSHPVSVTITPALSITTGSLPPATVGGTYNQAIIASGGVTPYTFSISSGAMPAGLSLSSGGLISGTPTAGGTFSFTVKVTDASSNTATKAYTNVTVAAPIISVTPLSLPSATQNSAYSQTITASGGTSTYTYAVTSGSLPPGVTLSSSGMLSGTPTSYGGYPVTITATDSSTGTGPYTGSAGYMLVVNAVTPTITTVTVPNGTVGISYSTALNASHGNAPYTFSLASGSLPPGLSINAAGVISGTPTAGGAYTFTVKVADAASSTATQTYAGVTMAAPVITLSPATLPGATQGSSFNASIAASGGSNPYTYAVTSGLLPAGVLLNASTGALSGTPTVFGNFNFTITATDSSGGTGPYTGSQPYSLSVAASMPVISSAALPSGTVGTGYSQTITASNGNAPYTFSISAGSLPPGLVLASGGQLSGTPTGGGSYSFTVKVTDASSNTATQAYTGVTINAPALTLSPSTAPAATVGMAYSQSFSAANGTAPYVYVESNPLPPGLSWNAATATLSGTPTQAGTFPITIQVTDSSGGSGPYTHNFTYMLQSNPPSLAMAPAGNSVLSAVYATAYSQSFTGTGGTSPYSYRVSSGSLPAGLSLSSSGVLSGSPTQWGNFSFAVTMIDSSTGVGAPFSVTANYSMTVASSSITLSPTTIASGTVGASYTATLNASGGIGPYSFAITAGSLPAGMRMSSNGALSGTPTAAGAFNLTVTATDANSFTSSQAYTLTIGAPTLGLSPVTPALPSATAESAYNQSFSTTGGVGPYHYAVTSGALPAGLSLNSSGVLGGTATMAGVFSFSVTSTDSSTGTGAPFTATRSYTLTVQAPSLSISPGTLPNPQQGTAYSQSLSASGGTGGYSYSVSAGALPAGLVLSSSGLLSGTPTVNGPFSFSITASDSNHFTATQSYSIVVGVPVAPTAAAKSASTPYNTAATINLGGSITGVDITAVNITTAPAHGTVSVSGETVTYTPSSTFYGGTDSFTYTVTNPGGTSMAATVTVLVGTPAAPTVAATSANTTYNTAASIDLSTVISGVDVTAVHVATGPAHGTASVSGMTVLYTPSSTFYGGADSFTYTATNPGGTSTSATVTVMVGAPAVATVTAKSASTPYNTATAIDLSSLISGVDVTSVAIATAPAHGTATLSGKTVTYTPASTYYGGTDSFTYTA
ncbi:beta strand repeat-containing protein, partial [Dyella japonica]|uniref:beta strand repeat-containing protein n=4 Tax=Dyella japonica TaxID=231455 RepID=UPI00037E0C4C